MTMTTLRLSTTSLLLAFGLLISGCTSATNDVLPTQATGFHSDDECHICGMVIMRFPGPKGEAANARGKVRKFCSSTELFQWWLQPENQRQSLALFVHDMGNTDWFQPENEHLMDAKSAHYVMAPHMRGAMGTPIASFSELEKAKTFAAKDNAPVLSFDELIEQLQQQQTHMGHHH